MIKPGEATGAQARSRRTSGVITRLTHVLSDHGAMEIGAGVTIDDDCLARFAARHAIRRVAAFGSVLHPDFRADSDIDLLVEFEPGRSPGLLAMAATELELGALLGREVDLRTYGDLSRYFRDEVRSTAKELYAA